MPYANNKDADQPAHLRSLISVFVLHCLDSIISLVSMSAVSSLWLVSVAEQASLSLTWSKIPKTGFLVSDEAHMYVKLKNWILNLFYCICFLLCDI